MARGYRDEDNEQLWRQDGVECIAETAHAILVRLKDGDEQWFPKSVIHDDSEVSAKHHEGEIVVQGWFAEKEGL
jgi:hypothetical protein